MLDYLMNLNPVFLALIACIFTYLFTALGAAIVVFFKSVNKSLMDGMLGFAAGVMISASFWSLLSPGIELSTSQGKCAWAIAAIGFLTGGIILFLGDKICSFFMKKYKNNHKNSLKRCVLLISSITIHNIPEGLNHLVHNNIFDLITIYNYTI